MRAGPVAGSSTMNSMPPSSSCSNSTSPSEPQGLNLKITPEGVFFSCTGVFTPRRMALFPGPKNSSAQPCTKNTARLASGTLLRHTSGPMKGKSNSGQMGGTALAEGASKTSKLAFTEKVNAWRTASAAVSREVKASSPLLLPSPAGRQRTSAATPEAAGGAPARTMTVFRMRLLVRLRAVEVSSSSTSSQEAALLSPKNEERLNPPFESWAPTLLRSTTFVISAGALPRTARRPARTVSKVSALSSALSAQTTADWQPASASSSSSKGNLLASARSIHVGSARPRDATSRSRARRTSPAEVPAPSLGSPHTATRPMPPPAAAAEAGPPTSGATPEALMVGAFSRISSTIPAKAALRSLEAESS
mmetsp:Transcript_40023/g.89993  ORF Transcript_40023/g.89993 Transcript_40023/m.89993 type:complete len:364 (+) Transcript_40023:200-1291(+)